MKAIQIQLSQNLTAIIDADDYERAAKHKWSATLYRKYTNGGKYLVRTHVKEGGKNICMYLHRFILGAPSGFHVDHINGDTLDNRKSNLRIATAAQNSWNVAKYANNTSGFKGVHFSKYAKKFQAYIGFNLKRIHLGYYSTAEEAAKAYDIKARELHGEFARLNFPSDSPKAEKSDV